MRLESRYNPVRSPFLVESIQSMSNIFQRIALIGLGEVGGILAADLIAREHKPFAAFDLRFTDAASPPSQTAAKLELGKAASAAEAVAGADLVISAVTAGRAMEAAQAVAPHLAPDAFYLDVNSVSPATKQAAAAVIEAAGGRYVESSVMSSFPPKRIRTPMLLGGPHAALFSSLAVALDFDAKVFGDQVGGASAVKMCRSVMVKGMEALFLESMTAARHYGVEKLVLASLQDTLPGIDTAELARYMISRAVLHGKRRAEEVREVAKTVEEAGIVARMSHAIAEHQDWAAVQGQTMERSLIADASLETLLNVLMS